MPRHIRATFFGAALVALLFAGSQALALVGPPWISVELPANPLDPSTRGAIVVVRTYHHEGLVPRRLTCAFEGIVDGNRRSTPCHAEDTRRPGVYAIRGDLPGDGVWMLVVSGGENQEFGTALVDLDADGEVGRVRVPSRRDGRWTIPTPISEREVTSMLRSRWNTLSHVDQDVPLQRYAGLGLLALLPLGGLLAAHRRRRRTLSRSS